MEVVSDYVANLHNFCGVEWRHINFTNTCTFDAFLTFLKVKSANHLDKLVDFNRSGAVSVCKMIGKVFEDKTLSARQQSDQVKDLWARFIAPNIRDLVGTSEQRVWTPLKGETDIYFFYRCINDTCLLAVHNRCKTPDPQSVARSRELGFPFIQKSFVLYQSGSLSADIANVRAICKACKQEAEETWPIVPNHTWLLRYHKPSAALFVPEAPPEDCPSRLDTFFDSKRGHFVLSYVELTKMYASGETHAFALFFLNGNYWLYDGLKRLGQLTLLGKTFVWRDILNFKVGGQTPQKVVWENAIYSRVIPAEMEDVLSEPPTREASVSTAGSSSVASTD